MDDPLICCKTAKTPCALRWCPVKKNEPALSHKRLSPSVRGRDTRERAWIAAHPNCQHPGCTYVATAVHHVEGRGSGGWNRTKSPLLSLCSWHHEAVHRGVAV